MNNQRLDQQLLNLVGYHARTVRREFSYPQFSLFPQLKVCSVCCTPISPEYSLCYPCNQRSSQFGNMLADLVVPLSYAVRGHSTFQQFYSDLNQYKFDQPSVVAQKRLKALMLLFRRHHQRCLETAVGLPISAVIAVPSGKNRLNHPLPLIAAKLTDSLFGFPGVPLLPARFVGQIRTGRAQTTNPQEFAIDGQLSGHVVIVEDTWVKGHNAQGLAVKARQQGAEKVSIVVLARMLDYNYSVTKPMVDTWASEDRYDPSICPVTGQSH